MFPGRIGEKGQRPQVGYTLFVLHAQSNMIFGAEAMGGAEGLEPLLGRVPGWLLSRLADNGLRPKEIHIQSARLLDVLQPAFKELDTKVFISSRESRCGECGEDLGRSAWITPWEAEAAGGSHRQLVA